MELSLVGTPIRRTPTAPNGTSPLAAENVSPPAGASSAALKQQEPRRSSLRPQSSKAKLNSHSTQPPVDTPFSNASAVLIPVNTADQLEFIPRETVERINALGALQHSADVAQAKRSERRDARYGASLAAAQAKANAAAERARRSLMALNPTARRQQ